MAALLGAVLMAMTGSLSRAEAAAALDFSTLAVLLGMMVLLTVLMRSGLPTWLALNTLNRCRSLHSLLTLVVFSTGLASAVMLLVTPPAIKLSLQCATHCSEAPDYRIWEMGGWNDEYCATNKHPRSGL